MFRRHRRGTFRLWARDLILIEFGLVAFLILTPLLSLRVIPTESPRARQSVNCQTRQENDAPCEGVIVWVARGIGSFIDADRDDISAISTFVVGVFTFILAVSTIGLWRETERLAKGADEQSKKLERSIAAVNAQSEAARKANEISDKAIIAEQRPWISATPSATTNAAWSNGTFVVGIGFLLKNTGRTPAIQVLVSAQLAITGFENQIARQTALVNDAISPSVIGLGQGIVLFPGDEQTMGISVSVPVERVQRYVEVTTAAKSGLSSSLPLSLVGCVTYRATMDGSVHKTVFHLGVMKWRPPPDLPIIIGIDEVVSVHHVNLTYSVNGNYAD